MIPVFNWIVRPGFSPGWQEFGLRWQSAAATPLFIDLDHPKNGVALRFPLQSKSAVPESVALNPSKLACHHTLIASALRLAAVMAV
jgi:hypothetical protein